MVRLIGILVGLGFVGIALISFLTGFVAFLNPEEEGPVAYDYHLHPRNVDFTFEGPLGRFDRAQLQRGFQVYKEACAACHGINLVAFRNLEQIGYSEAEVRAIADQWAVQVPSINPDTGEASSRKALPSDQFPSPYPNEVAARAANNNAYPPDLSLIAKAREDGAQYVYSLLTGYQAVPADLPAELRPGQGLHYNPYFPNLNIAMPPPLSADGQVEYVDGTPATIDQMAQDVSTFLQWTAEPFLENRHRAGIATLIFLLIATILAYLSYRNIWAEKKAGIKAAHHQAVG